MTDEELIEAMKRALMTMPSSGPLEDGFRAVLAAVASELRRRALEEAEKAMREMSFARLGGVAVIPQAAVIARIRALAATPEPPRR